MARPWIALFAVILIGFVAYRLVLGDTSTDNQPGSDVAFINWPPSPAEVRRLAGVNGTDPQTPEGYGARDRFATQFKNRFRKHDPMMAVGLKFDRLGKVDLLMPPRMEPWTMDRLAIDTWHETQAAFGHPFDIDLFITYIGAPPVKIGELRASAGSPGKIAITHTKRGPVLMPIRGSF